MELKDQIEAANAILHIQNVQTIYEEMIIEYKQKWEEMPVMEKFVGKYVYLNTDDGNLSQHHLNLASRKTCTLHIALNDSKNFNQKSSYTFDYKGIYFIQPSDNPNTFLLKGILEYPQIKKIHNAKQTQPPSYKQEFFENFLTNASALLVGKFSPSGNEVNIKVHYADLFKEDNSVLTHYFGSQEYDLKRQK